MKSSGTPTAEANHARKLPPKESPGPDHTPLVQADFPWEGQDGLQRGLDWPCRRRRRRSHRFRRAWFSAWLNRNTEKAKWQRDKLYEVYREALRYSRYPPRNDHAEKEVWLNLLLMYFPDKNSKEYRAFADKVKRGEDVRDDILAMGSKDRRLQEGSLEA